MTSIYKKIKINDKQSITKYVDFDVICIRKMVILTVERKCVIVLEIKILLSLKKINMNGDYLEPTK